MNQSKVKRKTLIDLYRLYPHKKNRIVNDNTIPRPFVKQQDCTDNKLSADYDEWLKVVEHYIEKLKLKLENGESIEIGSKTGEFKLTKLKSNRFIDFKKSKEQKRQVRFAKNNIDNYFICSSWIKRRVNFKLKSYWKIDLNRAWLRKMYLAAEKDYTKIYKLQDA